MVASLLAGVGLALGHHFYYASLAGTIVDTGNKRIVGIGVSSQQFHIAVGTSFAFLVKVCLVLAVTIAYTQAFWRAIGHKTTKISTIDVIDSALGNFLALFRVQTWWRYPLLLLLALCVWLIPIASTITPATLSVDVAAVSPAPSAKVHVPHADFNSLKFVRVGNFPLGTPDPNEHDVNMVYNGPSMIAERIARTAASMGNILAIEPPALNASWEMSFPGPFLSCEDMDSAFLREVEESIMVAYANGSNCQDYVNYLSWVPNTQSAPFVNPALPYSFLKPFNFNTGTLGPLVDSAPSYIPPNATSPAASIYFAVIRDMQRTTAAGCPLDDNAQYEQFFDFFNTGTYLQCQLYNTTYHTRFTYMDGVQSIDVNFPDIENRKPVSALSGVFINGGADGCNMLITPVNETNLPCTMDPFTLQSLSFQAIMDVFGRVMTGWVRYGSGNGNYGNSIITSTSVFSTNLVSTPEMSFMTDRSNWINNTYWIFNSSSEFRTLYPPDLLPSNISFKQGLEQLFQNITISMMSAASLQPNLSSPFLPDPVLVTFANMETVYTYSAANLLVIYGIAILLTSLSVTVGLVCITLTGASFSGNFSTVLRATRDADISAHIEEDHRDGRNPLPGYMKKATISFSGGVFKGARGPVRYTPGLVQEHVKPKGVSTWRIWKT